MTQEEKQLLLIDLCARLPYEVKVRRIIHTTSTDTIESVEIFNSDWLKEFYAEGVEFKPYLRPMLSMTEEEKKELSRKYNWRIINNTVQIRYHSDGYWDDETDCSTEEYFNLFNWLNAHHFDYHGLIEKGLALEAPKGMYEVQDRKSKI